MALIVWKACRFVTRNGTKVPKKATLGKRRHKRAENCTLHPLKVFLSGNVSLCVNFSVFYHEEAFSDRKVLLCARLSLLFFSLAPKEKICICKVVFFAHLKLLQAKIFYFVLTFHFSFMEKCLAVEKFFFTHAYFFFFSA